MNRGLIFKKLFFVLLTLATITLLSAEDSIAQPAGWESVPKILKRIIPPHFPNRDFDVTKFGAVGDGVTDCTQAFADAIARCSKAGGGRVVVPEGTYLTGAIHLKNNVNFHVIKGATIKFSTDPKKYLPVVFARWEGVECMNYSPLIYAFARNVVLTLMRLNPLTFSSTFASATLEKAQFSIVMFIAGDRS